MYVTVTDTPVSLEGERVTRGWERALNPLAPMPYLSDEGMFRFRELVREVRHLDYASTFGADNAPIAEVRFIAAVLASTTHKQAAEQLVAIFGNEQLEHDAVAAWLRFGGDHLLPALQAAVRLLWAGETLLRTARAVGLSERVVRQMDAFLGTRQARHDGLLDACYAAREAGCPRRLFSEQHGITYDYACRLYTQAAEVEAELAGVSL